MQSSGSSIGSVVILPKLFSSQLVSKIFIETEYGYKWKRGGRKGKETRERWNCRGLLYLKREEIRGRSVGCGPFDRGNGEDS